MSAAQISVGYRSLSAREETVAGPSSKNGRDFSSVALPYGPCASGRRDNTY